jgi:LDH2 family malate/lactate/ureidoglycolate dehydrogenase
MDPYAWAEDAMDETPPTARGDYFLLPLGATRELGSHKGYGLAFMVETLSALLSGTLPYGLLSG